MTYKSRAYTTFAVLVSFLVFYFQPLTIFSQEWIKVNTTYGDVKWSFPYTMSHFSQFDFNADETELNGYYVDADGITRAVPFALDVLDSIEFVQSPASYGESQFKVFALNITTVDGAPVDSKEEYVDCYASFDGRGEFPDWSGTARIRGRGNSTWLWYPKKPYRLKLDVKSKILGLKKNRDWVLLANYRDPTDLMNTYAFETAAWMGLPFTNNTRYVEVFLNGDYIGLYQLTEQIEQGGNRVDISETDGVLLSFDLDDGPGLSPEATDNFYSEVYSMPMCVKYPEEPTAEQIEQIRSDFALLESAVRSADYATVDSLLDMDAFISMLQLQEYLFNVDFTAPRSVYMFRDAGGKYTMGPVWDWDAGYDFDWGSEHRFFSSYTRLMMGSDPLRQNGTHSLPRFFTDMFASADFVTKYKEQWESRSDSIYLRNWRQTYKYVRNLSKGAFQRDSDRWPIGMNTLSEVNKMSSWLSNRKDYLDETIANYPMPRAYRHCGSLDCSVTLDYSRGYTQRVKVQVNPQDVANLMGVPFEEFYYSPDISIMPLNHDGTFGPNGATGKFGGWFNEEGEPQDYAHGHVFIEVFNDYFNWTCGLRAENGYCEIGHEHTVRMQYQYPYGDEYLTVNINVTFKIED